MTTLLESLSESGRWATFQLAEEVLAVRVEDVQEVLMPQPLTAVPLAPDYIVGLLNLRGQIMPAVDLRRRLRYGPRPDSHEPRFLVLKVRGNLVSVVVDGVGDVLDLPAPDWRPPPDTVPGEHRRFIFGICPIQQQVILGLKVEVLEGDEELTGKGARS